MQSADRRVDQRDLTLTDGETTAVTSFLAANVKHMTKYHDGSLVPEEMLYAFVKRCKVENIEQNTASLPLYIRNTASDRCCIIITGHIKIIAGEEGFESEVGPWTILGKPAMTQTVYMPDFTAKVKGPDVARIMHITGAEYRNFVQGKRVPRRSFDQSFGTENQGPLGVKTRRQRRSRGSASGTVSPSSHSEEDEEDDLGEGQPVIGGHLPVPAGTNSRSGPAGLSMRLETIAPSPRLEYQGDPDDEAGQDGKADRSSGGSSGGGSPGARSPPQTSLPSPRLTEPAIFRLHSVEKDPYKDRQMRDHGTPGDNLMSSFPLRVRKDCVVIPGWCGLIENVEIVSRSGGG